MTAGYVPVAEIGPELGKMIRERWPHGGGYEVLAEKADCDQSAIEGIVSMERETAGFDLVDRLLCGVGGHGLWYSRFRHIYDNVEFRETCALPSCSKQFKEFGSGRTRKRYCSPRCSTLGNAMRRGEATGDRLRLRGYCLKGHRMTPENTITKWRERDGRPERQCRECKRITQREWMRRKRAEDNGFRERCIKRQQRWRAKQRMAA